MADSSDHLRFIKYVVLQTTMVPSLFCDLLVFAHFTRRWRKELRAAPQNHVILCLSIVSFVQKITDVPFYLSYLRWGTVLQQSPTFCVMWNWLDYSTLVGSLQLLTWCCLERHLFVFHSIMMKKRWCLILLHYIPLVVTVFYAPLFYAAAILSEAVCTNEWDYTLPLCGAVCYLFVPVLSAVDLFFHYVFPVAVIIIANTLLFARFLWQKILHQRLMRWSRQRRLIIQLAFIAALFLIFLTPLIVVSVIQTFFMPDFLSELNYDYFYYLPYFANVLLPFAIISSLPKMRSDLYKWMVRMKMDRRHLARTYPMIAMNVAVGPRTRAATVAVKSSQPDTHS